VDRKKIVVACTYKWAADTPSFYLQRNAPCTQRYLVLKILGLESNRGLTTYSTKQNNKFAWKEILTILSSEKEIQAVPTLPCSSFTLIFQQQRMQTVPWCRGMHTTNPCFQEWRMQTVPLCSVMLTNNPVFSSKQWPTVCSALSCSQLTLFSAAKECKQVP
jgi:hypothetical protein